MQSIARSTTRLTLSRLSARHAAPSNSPLAGRGRPFHGATTTLLPYKDSQDRESLKPEGGENTKSGSDADVTAQSEAAFDPNKTDPHEAKATAGKGKGSGGNPLEVSGANQDMSKPQGDNASGEAKGGERAGKAKKSRGETPKKHGKGA